MVPITIISQPSMHLSLQHPCYRWAPEVQSNLPKLIQEAYGEAEHRIQISKALDWCLNYGTISFPIQQQKQSGSKNWWEALNWFPQ